MASSMPPCLVYIHTTSTCVWQGGGAASQIGSEAEVQPEYLAVPRGRAGINMQNK